MANIVKVSFKLSLIRRQFLNKQWTPNDGRDVMQIVENELSLNNFPDVFRAGQGGWTPLTPKYQKWKDRNYPGKLKWELTGSSMQALNTPAHLSASGGHVSSKHITLDHARRGVVVAEYEIRKPAAGGHFGRINSLRMIWTLMDKHRQAIVAKISDHIIGMMRKGGF